MTLLDHRAHGGARRFASFREGVPPERLRAHLGRLAGLSLGEFLTDRMTEAWIDFTYRGYDFTVNNQVGQFWFFVDQPDAPASVLEEVTAHVSKLLA